MRTLFVFDMDGLLIDSEQAKYDAWQHLLSQQGLSISFAQYRDLVGTDVIEWPEIFAKMLHADIKFTYADFEAVYSGMRPSIEPIADALTFLHSCYEKKKSIDICIGLASSESRENIEYYLSRFAIENKFDVVVSGADDLNKYDDSEGKKKPKPYIYIEAARQAGIEPMHAVAFEDTPAGIEAAIAAGMCAVAVPNKFTLHNRFENANLIFYQGFMEVTPEFVKNLIEQVSLTTIT